MSTTIKPYIDGYRNGDMIRCYKNGLYGSYTVALFGSFHEFMESGYMDEFLRGDCFAEVMGKIGNEITPIFELSPTIQAKDGEEYND